MALHRLSATRLEHQRSRHCTERLHRGRTEDAECSDVFQPGWPGSVRQDDRRWLGRLRVRKSPHGCLRTIDLRRDQLGLRIVSGDGTRGPAKELLALRIRHVWKCRKQVRLWSGSFGRGAGRLPQRSGCLHLWCGGGVSLQRSALRGRRHHTSLRSPPQSLYARRASFQVPAQRARNPGHAGPALGTPSRARRGSGTCAPLARSGWMETCRSPEAARTSTWS